MVERRLRIAVVSDEASTDAVAIDDRDRLLASVRVAATADVRVAIGGAIRALMAHDAVDPAAVRWAMLGGGQLLADVARVPGLRRVAVVRIGAPLTLAVPPLAAWPTELRETVSAGEIVVAGGAEFDGRTMAALDEDAIAHFLAALGDRAQAVAISGVFASVSPQHELAAGDVARRELGSLVHVSHSHEIAGLGLLERENATVLNAALGAAVGRVGAAAGTVLAELGSDAEILFAQNDGTLMVVTHAQRFPALMLASGPGTAIRGAAHLSGVGDAVVAWVGDAGAYVGALVDGVPRERVGPTQIAGVRTSLRLPDVRRVAFAGEPAAASGGTARAPAHAIAALAGAIEDAKAARPTLPLVVVGPGHRLVPDRLPGVSDIIRPPDAQLGHAIGAALASVSGQAARVCLNRPDIRRTVLEDVRAAALARAIDAGAHPHSVEVVEVDELPLTYLLHPAIQIRVRAAGPCW
ncbi:MAG TPA: hydantoinase/oxoprolinase N-terminal domain-containing protein [Solirubrobacteraceae bacterium]|jgi:N-methylhydantoinase A/oxoprolinase/acetone carboxylase beta subunit|nr:hydantoinase/oxoprolinase N-terminal domain-containing protein [Solirubrobacteraceae bacterium]